MYSLKTFDIWVISRKSSSYNPASKSTNLSLLKKFTDEIKLIKNRINHSKLQCIAITFSLLILSNFYLLESSSQKYNSEGKIIIRINRINNTYCI